MIYPGLSGLYFVEDDGISPDLPQPPRPLSREEFEISPTLERKIVKVGDRVIGKVLSPKLHCGDWILSPSKELMTVLEITFDPSPEVEDDYWNSYPSKGVNLAAHVPGNWIFKLMPENPDSEHPEKWLLGREITPFF